MRRLAFAFALLAVPFLSGCITLFSKTEVVRDSETKQPVSFDSPEARDVFESALKERQGVVSATYVGGPFVTLYSRAKVLSEAAKFNDCMRACDQNRDGVITETEARTFAQVKE
jgi:hypothetical protein